MKERPILFSGPMVRAILDGRKTQTRRVVKPQPSDEIGDFLRSLYPCRRKEYEYMGDPEMGHEVGIKPYAFVGDILWVRETWAVQSVWDKFRPSLIIDAVGLNEVFYYATPSSMPFQVGKKRVSIHMPRWASRINLEITGIRVERLQDISTKDVESEGIDINWNKELSAQKCFAELWDSINGNRAPWDSNPWVWVVEFQPT